MRALFSRSLRVASFWRFWLFSRCTNARARTRTRSRDPGRLIQDRVAAVRKFALSKEEADSPRAHSSCYFRRAQSIINPPPPPSTTVPSSCEINPPPSPLPPSISKRKRSFRRKKHNISTLFVCISLSFPFLFYRHLVSGTISGQPPPCWGNTCSTLTSTRSLITRRVANALPATFPRESFETLNSSLART